MEDSLKSWLWGAVGVGLMLVLAGIVTFGTQPENLNRIYAGLGPRSAPGASGLTLPDPLSWDGNDAPGARTRGSAAEPGSRPSLDRWENPGLHERSAQRSAAFLRVAQPDKGASASAAWLASPSGARQAKEPPAPGEQERETVGSIQYGRVPRSRLMGRGLGPVRNVAGDLGGSAPAAGVQSTPRNFAADVPASALADTERQLQKIRQTVQGKNVGADQALNLLDQLNWHLDKAKQGAARQQEQ